MVFWDEAEGVPGTSPKWLGEFLVWFFGMIQQAPMAIDTDVYRQAAG